jgi:hypothetical protein
VNPISASDFQKTIISFPEEDFLTIMFLFNSDNISHKRILSEIHFMLSNLPDSRIKLIGISKGDTRNFLQLQGEINSNVHLVNDRKDKILNRFEYVCGMCIKILLVDKHCKLRYVASNFDPLFLREIIMRYDKEE